MGTKNARKCLDGECFCEEGYVLQDLRCLPGNYSKSEEPQKPHVYFFFLQERFLVGNPLAQSISLSSLT